MKVHYIVFIFIHILMEAYILWCTTEYFTNFISTSLTLFIIFNNYRLQLTRSITVYLQKCEYNLKHNFKILTSVTIQLHVKI